MPKGRDGGVVFFVAIASFIPGMGFTITAYCLLPGILLAPALVKTGLSPAAVHLFLMYCAILFITPPVAIAIYATALRANPMRTDFRAARPVAALLAERFPPSRPFSGRKTKGGEG